MDYFLVAAQPTENILDINNRGMYNGLTTIPRLLRADGGGECEFLSKYGALNVREKRKKKAHDLFFILFLVLKQCRYKTAVKTKH